MTKLLLNLNIESKRKKFAVTVTYNIVIMITQYNSTENAKA